MIGRITVNVKIYFKIFINQLIDKILNRTKSGRDLAFAVTNSAPLNKYEREQRYEIFINKMKQLYNSHRRLHAKAN